MLTTAQPSIHQKIKIIHPLLQHIHVVPASACQSLPSPPGCQITCGCITVLVLGDSYFIIIIVLFYCHLLFISSCAYFMNYILPYMSVLRKKNKASVGFSTIHGLRCPLWVLEPHGQAPWIRGELWQLTSCRLNIGDTRA